MITNRFSKEIINCLNDFNWNIILIEGLRDIQCFYFCKNVLFLKETKLKEKSALFSYSDAVARILGRLLHLTVVYRVGSLMLSVKESQFS